MSVFTGIIVFLLIFWVALFAVLPIGNRGHQDGFGTSGSAPENPRIKEKMIGTAVLSAVLWGIVYLLVHFQVIDFNAIGNAMVEEDYGD